MYNMNKLHGTPSSFDARNRLFLERNLKARRITAAMGVTFRNSKWTDLSYLNVNKLFEAIEPNVILNTVLAVFFIWVLYVNNSWSEFALFSYAYSTVELFISYTLDLFDTSLLCLLIIQFLNLASLNYFSGRVFNLLFNSFDDLDSKSKSTNYSLTLQPSNLNYQSNLYSKFNTTLDSVNSNSQLQLMSGRELFNVSNASNYNLDKTNFRSISTLSNLTINNLSRGAVVNSMSGSEKSFIPQNLPTNSGLFYLDTLSYQDLNLLSSYKELRSISQNLDSQRDMVNSLRWAYRYNPLHRRSLYNSHKLTESKKLLSTGFFDSSSMTSNLWFSDQYARSLNFGKKSKALESATLLKANWNLLYRPSLGLNGNQGFITNPTQSESNNNLNRLSFYESSFHFFLNRVKFYTSLKSHAINSYPTLDNSNRQVNFSNSHTLTVHNYSLNEGLKNSLSNFSKLNLVPSNSTKVVSSNSGLSYSDDLLVLYKDSESLTLRNLEVLFNLSKSHHLVNQKLETYDYTTLSASQSSSSYVVTWNK